MNDWKRDRIGSVLNGENPKVEMLISDAKMENACQWLLENSNSVIRYRTLTEIMGLNSEDERVEAAYIELLQSKRLQFIASVQNQDGSFGKKSFHHGTESTETYLRELLELGIKADFEVLRKGIGYAEKLHTNTKNDIGWIPGIYLESVGRSAPSQIVEEWFVDYIERFTVFLKYHKYDWLISVKGKPSTYYLEIPYIYVIRTIANSWWWLEKRNQKDILPILEFLLTDMASVSNLYWIAPNKQQFGYPNFFHILSPDVISSKVPSVFEFAIILEELWLLSVFGIIEKYPGLKNAFDFISSSNNIDGVWEFPIGGMTKAKAGWNSYHGFSLEEDWRRKESRIADLTFRICLIAARNKKGKT